MKHLFLGTLIALHSIVTQAQTQCGPPTYMRQALVNVIVKGILLNNLSDMGYNKDICILGTYLPKGEQVGFTTTLNAGTEYAFVGGGDDDVTDLDIYLVNDRGIEVAKDSKTDNSPIVIFTPSTTGRYTVRVKMFSTRTSGSFASMLIMSNKGYSIPVNTLKNAMVDLFSTVEAVCTNFSKMGFISTTNQWALYGCVLEEGGSSTVSSIRLSNTRKTVIVGGGDQNAYDVDLYLYDNRGNLLKKDEDNDAHPILTYFADGNSDYQIKMKNARSGGNRSLVMSAILEVN